MVTLRVEKPDLRQLAVFAWIWLTVGFAMGTATLLGPVRWATDLARGAGWQPFAEDALVRSMILLYVVLSLVVSLWLAGLGRRSERRSLRWGVPLLTTAIAAAALGLWMSPTLVNGLVATPVSSVSRFTFGPYPERARFEELRAEGYTAVISLLHPAVVPFEPTLLARERTLAEEFGIELIHAPMLPWVAENRESLERIEQLVESGQGRYYVHCYLGRDRVGMVRRLIESMQGVELRAHTIELAAAVEELREMGSALRAMEFERGEIFELDEGVFFAPYPTDEEFSRYVIGGGFAHVLSLLDPDNPDDRQWVEAERSLAATYRLGLTESPIPWLPFDAEALLETVDRARELPRPLLIHAFRSDVGVARAFMRAWRTGRAGVRADMLERPLERGSVRVIDPNVVVGPRPAGPEFGSRLEAAGVRNILYVGSETIDAADDRMVVTTETDLAWQAVERVDDEVLARLGRGGAWYVYGDDPQVLAATLAARLDLSLPAAAAAGRD